jgi:hypothetical protein
MGNRLVSTFEYEGVPLEVVDTRLEGEDDDTFIDRHFAHLRRVMAQYPPSP